MGHIGVGSWFTKLQHASPDIEIDERVTWIDIEDIPLRVWTHNTFDRISSKWVSLLLVEDDDAPYFHRKRICIKTALDDTIFETFKIIVKGKIFWIRAKEVTGWTPDFNIEEDDFSDSDVESLQVKNDDNFNKDDSDNDEVLETIFEHGESKSPDVKDQLNEGLEDAQSEDPFSLYKLLNKKHPNSDVAPQSVEEPKYPPGFTPPVKTSDHSNMENIQNSQDQIKEPIALKTVPITKLNVNADAFVCSGHFQNVGTPKTGGSILQLMEDLIKIGQTMGYKMDGCINNISEIVNIQGAQKSYQ
ncbi:hypothetical protein Tco_1331729 [Tanacetum coccineum]